MFIFLFVAVGLSVLILGHEAGHFFAAKLFGMKVDEFGFGFPPRIAAKRKGETEYSLNWLPFGGFVKITGEEEFMSADPARSGVHGEDSDGNPERRLAEAFASLSAQEKCRYFFFQPAWKRAVVIGSGVLINFLIGWMLISLIFMIGTPPFLAVSRIQPDSPASQAGILAGDVITRYATAKDFVDFVNRHRGESVSIEVRRGDKYLQFDVVPRAVTAPGQGAVGVLLSVGGVERRPFFPALWEGLQTSVLIGKKIITTFFSLFVDMFLRASLSSDVVGPIGIFGVAAEAGRSGLIYLVQLLGIISINLAVINIVPFPALDGGRLFLIAVEKLKGSPVSLGAQMWLNRVGFVFLVFLMVLISIRDVVRWF